VFKSRLWRALFWLACLAGVSYVLISLFLPSSRRLIFGVEKRTGKVRMVRQHVTYLPPHRFYRLAFEKREGAAQSGGLINITSKEGVPVTITYRLRFSVPGDHLPDARRLVTGGWSAWIRARVGEAVSAVAGQVPIEELLSPSSQFYRQRDPLRQTVARHLARSGLQLTAFEIVDLKPDREALLKYKRAELRRSARGVAGRVAVFAIDGADWDLLNEMIIDDRMPNLEALIRGGASASLQTIQPTVSPVVWTTAVTGVSPDRHGVIDFFSNRAPIESLSRRSPAVWEIAEAFGRHSVVVDWWTAWPPAPDNTVVFDTPVLMQSAAIHPPASAQRVAAMQVALETVGYEQVRRFMNISAAEYREAVASQNPADPVNLFREMLAKTWTDHRVALELYRQQSPLLMMMSYEGTDLVNHLFAPYHPPYREGISNVGYRKFWPTVANYYAEIDRLLGEWMQVLTEDTTVIILSAHGFRWEENRPRTAPAGRAALSDHRNPGVFVAYGQHVLPSRGGRSVSIYDVVPSILAILGLPESQDMPGQVATWAFRIAPVSSVNVVSYSEFFSPRRVPVGTRINVREYARKLQTIGHLLDPTRGSQPSFEHHDAVTAAAPRPLPPQQWSTYAYYNNVAVGLRKEGKLDEAVEALQKAIDINPSRPTPYLNMAMIFFDRQYYNAADEVFIQAVAKGLPNGDRWFVDFAALYREKNMISRGIALLYEGKEIFPDSALIAANLGSFLAEGSRYTEGLVELERALSLQPSSTVALNNLGTFYAKRRPPDYARALDFWNRSLTIDPQQPGVAQAARAARARL
jgi:predicted AlkP superfamily phosphohydrolase/phosphomutase/Tfp pilus assembly protein PilF